MKYNKEHLGKSGIYCIRNLINNKVYVGKAKCILSRIKQHVTYLNVKNKNENAHLINSWHKYGRKNFEYFIIEFLPLNNDLISKRELFWQRKFECFNPKKGYNFREDSETGLIVSKETRKKLSEIQIKRFSDPKERQKISISSSKMWESEERKNRMKNNLSKSRSRYSICQFNKDGIFLKKWETMKFLLDKNPLFKRHNIYAVCSGEKPSMYGFIWKKCEK